MRLDLESNTLTPQTIATGLNRPRVAGLMTGGRCDVAKEEGGQWARRIDRSHHRFDDDPVGQLFEPDLAVSPGDPAHCFWQKMGSPPGSIYRFDFRLSAPHRPRTNAPNRRTSRTLLCRTRRDACGPRRLDGRIFRGAERIDARSRRASLSGQFVSLGCRRLGIGPSRDRYQQRR